MEFSHTENPNYSNYFPNTLDTVSQNANNIKSNNETSSEPMPTFTSKPIAKQPETKDQSPGFFASLFGNDKTNSDVKICEELLDLNKTVLSDQNRNLKSLKSEKKQLLNEINNVEKNYQMQRIQDENEQFKLEAEIDRLNRLIKILASELK